MFSRRNSCPFCDARSCLDHTHGKWCAGIPVFPFAYSVFKPWSETSNSLEMSMFRSAQPKSCEWNLSSRERVAQTALAERQTAFLEHAYLMCEKAEITTKHGMLFLFCNCLMELVPFRVEPMWDARLAAMPKGNVISYPVFRSDDNFTDLFCSKM